MSDDAGKEIDLSQVKSVALEKIESWKEAGTQIKVKIIGLQGNSTTGYVFVHRLSPQERMSRALKTGAIFWGIGLFCVLIPILHFILVPLFLILGPAIGYSQYKQKSLVLGGIGMCPRCHEELPLVKGTEKWPLEDLCAKCHNAVKINPL